MIRLDNIHLQIEAIRADQVLVPCSRIELQLAREPAQSCPRTSGDSGHAQERNGERSKKQALKSGGIRNN